jgi:CheY-like chemotaxis protein
MADNNGKTILIVDDDEDFVFLEKTQFEAAGYKVLTAHNAADAMKAVQATRPDIALLDLMMEKPDVGFTLCYHIKKMDPTIPVIMITSVASETGIDFDASTDEERAWIKADALLRKPIRFEQLEREIKRHMKE